MSVHERRTKLYFETFIRSPKRFLNYKPHWEHIGQFSAGPNNKAVPSFTNSLTRVYMWTMTEDILYEHSSLLKKSVRSYGVRAVLNIVETIFGNVSTAKFPWLKAAYNVVNFADNILKLSTFTDNWMNNHCVKFYIIPLYIVLEKLAKFCIGDTFWRARGSTETYINYSIMNAQNIWSAISVEINFENRSTNCWNSELLLFRCPTPRQLDWIRPDAQSIESGRCVHALIQFFSGVQLLINGIGTWYPGDTCSVGYWLHCALAMRRSVL